MAKIIWNPQKTETIQTTAFNEHLREPRIGCLLHFDASASDAGAIAWFKDSRCFVSYHFLIKDDGSYVEIAPKGSRAWHAGRCRPSNDLLDYKDANSAFVGLAVATNQHASSTYLQALTVAWLTWQQFVQHGWPTNETWRIVGHESEAWPRGRKIDPTGTDRKRPILSVEGIRNLVPLFRLL